MASKTGWSESFIRWDLPLARGYAYYHAARLIEGENCRWPGGGTDLKSWFDSVGKSVRDAVASSP